MTNKLILFDIDKTLLSASQGHVEAFAVAFKEVYGVNGSMYMVQHHGKTDQQIIHEVLASCGISKTVINRKMADCIQTMCGYFDVVKQYIKVDVIPGVPESLEVLNNSENLLGLVTGNLEPIAHGKLDSVGIDSYFKLGGFGNEAIERADLVKLAVKKAESQFGFEKDGNVYLFGDAPQDMQAAVESGVMAIGVTTGIYSADDLRRAGASEVVNSIGNQAAVLEATSTKSQ